MGIDASIEESLFRYNTLYNPNTNDAILHLSDDVFNMSFIDKDDVVDAINSMEDGFFSFIGTKKANYIQYAVDSSNLATFIQDINQYSGLFRIDRSFDLSIDDLIDRFTKERG